MFPDDYWEGLKGNRNLKLPELPDKYRWTVEAAEKKSGVLCYKVFLERKKWLLWEVLEVGLSEELTKDSACELATNLWNKHQMWLEAKRNEGEYYGNNQHREK